MIAKYPHNSKMKKYMVMACLLCYIKLHLQKCIGNYKEIRWEVAVSGLSSWGLNLHLISWRNFSGNSGSDVESLGVGQGMLISVQVVRTGVEKAILFGSFLCCFFNPCISLKSSILEYFLH